MKNNNKISKVTLQIIEAILLYNQIAVVVLVLLSSVLVLANIYLDTNSLTSNLLQIATFLATPAVGLLEKMSPTYVYYDGTDVRMAITIILSLLFSGIVSYMFGEVRKSLKVIRESSIYSEGILSSLKNVQRIALVASTIYFIVVISAMTKHVLENAIRENFAFEMISVIFSSIPLVGLFIVGISAIFIRLLQNASEIKKEQELVV